MIPILLSSPNRGGRGEGGCDWNGAWFGILMGALNGRKQLLVHDNIALDSSGQNITGH